MDKFDALRKMEETIRRNLPLVDRRAKRAGITLDPAVRMSMAKYWWALEKLAKE